MCSGGTGCRVRSISPPGVGDEKRTGVLRQRRSRSAPMPSSAHCANGIPLISAAPVFADDSSRR